MNPACDKIELLLPAQLAGELSAEEAALVRTHLETCPACRELAESLRLLSGAMTLSPLPETLEPARVDAIKAHFARSTSAAAPRPDVRAGALWSRFRRWWTGEDAEPSLLASLGRLAVFVLVPLAIVVLTLPATQHAKQQLSSARFEYDAVAPVGAVALSGESSVTPPAKPSAGRPVDKYAYNVSVANTRGRFAAEPTPPPAPTLPESTVQGWDVNGVGAKNDTLMEGAKVANSVVDLSKRLPESPDVGGDSLAIAGKPVQRTSWSATATPASGPVAVSDPQPASERQVASRYARAITPERRDESRLGEVAAEKPAGLEASAELFVDADHDGVNVALADANERAVTKGLYAGRVAGVRGGGFGGGGGAVGSGTSVPAAPPAEVDFAEQDLRGNVAHGYSDRRRQRQLSEPVGKASDQEGAAAVDGKDDIGTLTLGSSLKKMSENLPAKGAQDASGPASAGWYFADAKSAAAGNRKDSLSAVVKSGAGTLALGDRSDARAKNKEVALGLQWQEAKPVTVNGRIASAPQQVEEKKREEEELEPLRTDIPKPMFVGTPIPIKLPNMEPPNASPISDRFAREERAKKNVERELVNKEQSEASRLDLAGVPADGGAALNFSGVTTVSGGTLLSLSAGQKGEAAATEAKGTARDERGALTAGRTVVGNGAMVLSESSLANLPALSAPVAATTAAADAPRPAPPRQPAGFNPYVEALADAFSTFAIDVDTASYTLTRRALDEGRLPDPEQVRTEEIVNAFDYDYTPPARGAFALHAALAPSPFRSPLDLLQIGIQGALPGRDAKKAAVLTLVIDASGSMDTPDRLGRIRTALRMLAAKLQPQDSVAIVAFGNEPRLLLDRTPGTNRRAILAAIDGLSAAGSTQLEGGMRLGYEVAARGFVSGAANRVLLLSDGVANLGAATAQEILASVETFRKQGIYLTVLGFGSGNYDDAMLMTLADKGDGMYAFVDSDEEARRLLVDQWEQTMHVIARDAKIQVEFNPERVARWRQIGYEKRQLKKQDFRNDSVDAGEVGSGQSVTALYDVELKSETGIPARSEFTGKDARVTIATLRVRYQDPDTGRVTELERRITDADRAADFGQARPRFRVAACAAEFAELLRVSPYTAGSEFATVVEQLRPAAQELSLDQRVQELLRMAERARSLAK